MSSLINKVLFTRAGYGLTILRIAVGVIFAAHGSQKLFGLFGGYGLAGTAQYMESIGLTPGYLMATLAGGTEFFAGLALIIGLLVRPAALGLTFLSLVAIFTVHISNGLFMANNGYEFALALLGGSLAVLIEGAGKLSVDRAIAGRSAASDKKMPVSRDTGIFVFRLCDIAAVRSTAATQGIYTRFQRRVAHEHAGEPLFDATVDAEGVQGVRHVHRQALFGAQALQGVDHRAGTGQAGTGFICTELSLA